MLNPQSITSLVHQGRYDALQKLAHDYGPDLMELVEKFGEPWLKRQWAKMQKEAVTDAALDAVAGREEKHLRERMPL